MRKSARQFESSPHFNAPPHADVAPRMPLIRLKPHKARVVIEDGAEMILVLMVTLNRGESVELASGGRMETMKGMLRIRERGGLLARADGKTQGRLTFVPETVSARQSRAAGVPGRRAARAARVPRAARPRARRKAAAQDLHAGRRAHDGRTARRDLSREGTAAPASTGTTSRIVACRCPASRSSCRSTSRTPADRRRATRAATMTTSIPTRTTTRARPGRLEVVRIVGPGRRARGRVHRVPGRDAASAHRDSRGRRPDRADRRTGQRAALPALSTRVRRHARCYPRRHSSERSVA